MEYIKGGDNAVADSFSRLPLENGEDQVSEEMSYLNFIESQNTPIDSDRIKTESSKDPVISKINVSCNSAAADWLHTKFEETVFTFLAAKQSRFDECSIETIISTMPRERNNQSKTL